MAAGLPLEGEDASLPTAGTVARQDVPTCSVDERMADVRTRVQGAGWDTCVVVNEDRVVFGVIRPTVFETETDVLVEDVMQPGPSTFRPHVLISELAHYMADNDLVSSPVTTSDGRLVGLLRQDDALAAAHANHEDGSTSRST